MSRPTRIAYWRHLDLPGDPVFKALLDEFHRTHPAIEVDFREVPWDEEHDALLAAAAEDNLPDCSDVVEYWWGEWLNRQLVEPLDDFIAGWLGRDDLIEEYWTWVRRSPDEPIYFIGGGMGCNLLWYRADLFDRAGIAPPNTLAEVAAVASALTKPPDTYGIGLRGSRVGHRFWGDLVRAGGLTFPPPANAPISPAAATANEWFVHLYTSRQVTPPNSAAASFSDLFRWFVSGEVAMMTHTTHSGPVIQEALGERAAAVPMPAGPAGRFSTLYPQSNAIYRTSRNKQAAWEFISWLAEAPQIARWTQHPRRSLLPTAKSLMDDPAYSIGPAYKASWASRDSWSRDPWFHPAFGSYVEDVWPRTWQQAALGYIDSLGMLEVFRDHFASSEGGD